MDRSKIGQYFVTKILFLSANPSDTVRLRIDEEVRGIERALIAAEFREVFNIEKHFAVQVDDLSSLLMRYQPQIVHFSGHGSDENQIIVENGSGSNHPLTSQALGKLFSILKDNIRCVVLNACYSHEQAKAIAQHIDCVIGMSSAIDEGSAIKFSRKFYTALGYGRNVKTAFDLACWELGLKGMNDMDVPKLIADRCNPSDISFVHRGGDLIELEAKQQQRHFYGVDSESVKTLPATVELLINVDYHSFSEDDQTRLLNAMRELLSMEEEIKINRIRPGSVLMDIELPLIQAEKLLELIEAGQLEKYNIYGGTLLSVMTNIASEETLGDLGSHGYSSEELIQKPQSVHKDIEPIRRSYVDRMKSLLEVGQSIWLDYIERSMVHSGELAKLVAGGIRGVTSNPTIFQQAIANSDAYDEDLAALSRQGKSAKEIFETLAVADIQAATDVLVPIYNESGGSDGFVSIEVAPDLAHDTGATIEEARRLHKSVNRPNVMIKVPATEPGIAAIRQLISEGISINVTLIFSLERYAAVKEAYLQGLEDRVAQGGAIDGIASVASFFISRVDSNVDGKLEKATASNGTDPKALMGKTALANAKLAYAQFQAEFSGARWEALAAKGAQLQRPLWASTRVKNPDYPDLLYAEPLMGPHTVNTMHITTLDAFQDHGVVASRVEEGVADAALVFMQLAALDISIDQVTEELEQEGVKNFVDSYTALLATIEQQRKKVVSFSNS